MILKIEASKIGVSGSLWILNNQNELSALSHPLSCADTVDGRNPEPVHRYSLCLIQKKYHEFFYIPGGFLPGFLKHHHFFN